MKAKNIFKIFFLGSILLFTSCDEKDLDLKYELADIYDTETGNIASEDKLEYATNGIYSIIGGASFYGAQFQFFNDIVSDNVFVSNTNSGFNLGYQNINWTNDSDLGFLNSGYNVINQANIVINENSLPSTERTKSLKGEAKILRALAYFTLVQLYSNTPTSGLNQEYGLPLNLGLYNPNFKHTRSTVDETYNQIIKDLSEGINEMAPEYRGNKKTYVSPLVGKFILSKVYLSRGKSGDYDKAISLADEVLSVQKPIIGSELYNYFTSIDVALSEGQPETLFEIEQTSNFNAGVNAALGNFYASTGTQRSVLARQWIYDLYSPSDIRVKLFNTTNNLVTDSPKGIWLRKWPRNTSDGNYTMNVKIFRATEASYVKMEALVKSGRGAEALVLLNKHAVERGATAYVGDPLTAILLDKQKEFIGEGHRFLDLKRNGLGFERKTNCLSCGLSSDSKYWVIPMPLAEMNRNPNMTQHPLWK